MKASKRIIGGEVREIVSSMNIEGFKSTYEEVEKTVVEFYENDEPRYIRELCKQMKEPGADQRALIKQHLVESEGRRAKNKMH